MVPAETLIEFIRFPRVVRFGAHREATVGNTGGMFGAECLGLIMAWLSGGPILKYALRYTDLHPSSDR